MLYLVFNTAKDPRSSSAEGKFVEESLEDLIVGMQEPVREESDDVFR